MVAWAPKAASLTVKGGVKCPMTGHLSDAVQHTYGERALSDSGSHGPFPIAELRPQNAYHLTTRSRSSDHHGDQPGSNLRMTFCR